MKKVKSTVFLMVVATWSLAGCRADFSTGEFSTLAVAYVAGRVTTMDGARLKGAQIVVQPQREGQLYAIDPVYTDANGNYRYKVRRMGQPLNLTYPDTVTATIMLAMPRRTPNATYSIPPSRKLSVRLTFAPLGGREHPAAIGDFRVVLPAPR
jgi:hypothetical protein